MVRSVVMVGLFVHFVLNFSSFWATSLFVLVALSVQNDCIDGEVYMEKYSEDLSNISIVTAPENGTLKAVGNKWCGFIIRKKVLHHCKMQFSIEFAAVNVTENIGTRCTVYSRFTLCVCNFYACNTVPGTLYQALVNSLDVPKTLAIPHPSDPKMIQLPDVDRDAAINSCLMQLVEKAYDDVVQTRLKLNRLSWIKLNSKFFPNATIVNQTIEAGLSKYPPSTIPPTTLPTSTLATTETTPKVEAAALKQDAPSAKNKSDSSGSMNGLTYGLIAVICLLLLVIAGLVGFIFFKMNDSKPKTDDTKKVENSKSVAESGSQMSKV